MISDEEIMKRQEQAIRHKEREMNKLRESNVYDLSKEHHLEIITKDMKHEEATIIETIYHLMESERFGDVLLIDVNPNRFRRDPYKYFDKDFLSNLEKKMKEPTTTAKDLILELDEYYQQNSKRDENIENETYTRKRQPLPKDEQDKQLEKRKEMFSQVGTTTLADSMTFYDEENKLVQIKDFPNFLEKFFNDPENKNIPKDINEIDLKREVVKYYLRKTAK